VSTSNKIKKMPSTTVVPEIKSHVIKESINDQNLLPNELFEGEIARANEFGEVRTFDDICVIL